MVYHAKVIGPGSRVYQCEHNHRTETAAITCARSSRTRQMAAMVWQRDAARAAQAAELARQRREAKAAAEARRAAARAAAEQAKADKRAAKLAAMPPQRAWKRMTPGERLLRTADLEMETYEEIRSPDAKAAYDTHAAKRAVANASASSGPASPGATVPSGAPAKAGGGGSYYVVNAKNLQEPFASRATHIIQTGSGYKDRTLCGVLAGRFDNAFHPYEASCDECRGRWQLAKDTPRPQQRAKAESNKQAAGCLTALLVIAIIITVVVVAIVNSGPSGPALAVMQKIHGCTSIKTWGGNSLDDNTVSEGSCQLYDGTNVNVYVWASFDVADQHDYVYQSDSNCVPPSVATIGFGNSPDGCFVGSNPQPWFIDVATSNFVASGAESDWAPVENGLADHGVTAIHVTKAPLSWCSTVCPYPGEPSGGGGFGGFGDGD